MAVSAFYGACDVVLSPSAAADARSRRSGCARAGAALGPRRGHVALPTRPARLRAARRHGARSTVLYSGRITTEKGIELLADAFLLRARMRARGCGCCWPAVAPRRSAARASRRERHLPRLAGGRRARAGIRERGHVPVPELHRHLRPGDPRGTGERPAGDRGSRGRSAVADRAPHERPACAAPTRRAWREAMLELAARRCCARPRPRRAARRARSAPGSARSSGSRTATARHAAARIAQRARRRRAARVRGVSASSAALPEAHRRRACAERERSQWRCTGSSLPRSSAAR